MSTQSFDEHQVMLTLALLAYRGFSTPLLGSTLDQKAVYKAVLEGLSALPPVRDQWDIVWGPACYGSPLSIFHDSMMYVVRNRAEPHRYVIAIRGTNPINGIDWIFGDFWVGKLLPWPYGDAKVSPDAQTSLSTSLGLKTLQHLRAPTFTNAHLAARGRSREGSLPNQDQHEEQPSQDQHGQLPSQSQPGQRPDESKLSGLFRPLQGSIKNRMKTIRTRLCGELEGWQQEISRWYESDVAGRIERILKARDARASTPVLDQIDQAINTLGDSTEIDLLRLLEGSARLRASVEEGPNLLEFFEAAVQDSGEALEIRITGHSKGGALSIAVALWLADTQGTASVAPEQQWDPAGTARILCYAFAGPTPGNAAYANRVDKVLGTRCHRIANRLDIVPHAWEPELLERVPGLYTPDIASLPGLDRLASMVCKEVGALDYRHPNARVTLLEGKLNPKKDSFPEQMVHQHLDAYLEQMDLSPMMSTDTFFDPLHM